MIYVFGDAITDVYIYGKSTRLSPEAPVPVVDVVSTKSQAGGALNVYENILAYTQDVKFMTRNIGLEIIKQRIYANGHYITRVDINDSNGIWVNDFPEVVNKDDVIVISDYAKGAVTAELIQKCIATGAKVIVDPKKDLGKYSGVWCLKPNRVEFEAYCGQTHSVLGLMGEAILARKRLNVDHLIVTLGEDGAIVASESGIQHIKPKTNIEVSDVTGAGDTFTAVIATETHKQNGILDAIVMANEQAGIAVSHHGIYVPQKRKLIFTNGCFDILHPGHIHLLNECKKLGDVIVGINSDESVKRLKGNGRPVNSVEHRKQMLESLGYQVVVFDEDTPYELIREIKPDIIVKGGDYTPETVVGNDICDIVIVDLVDGHSTSKIIERIKS